MIVIKKYLNLTNLAVLTFVSFLFSIYGAYDDAMNHSHDLFGFGGVGFVSGFLFLVLGFINFIACIVHYFRVFRHRVVLNKVASNLFIIMLIGVLVGPFVVDKVVLSIKRHDNPCYEVADLDQCYRDH